MMTIKNPCVLILGIVLLMNACKKDGGDYRYSNAQHLFPGNSYEYLKSNTGRFDSLLLVLDRLHLSDSLKTGKYTLFAPTNTSFRFVLENLNDIRKAKQLPPIYLQQADSAQLDTMMTKYIVRQVFNAGDMNYADGITMYSVRYTYSMNGRQRTTNAEGVIGGGPAYLEYSDMRKSKYTREWVTTTTQSVNLATTTGMVHVLRDDHAFGFDEFVLRLNK